jgi:hypothetical protein
MFQLHTFKSSAPARDKPEMATTFELEPSALCLSEETCRVFRAYESGELEKTDPERYLLIKSLIEYYDTHPEVAHAVTIDTSMMRVGETRILACMPLFSFENEMTVVCARIKKISKIPVMFTTLMNVCEDLMVTCDPFGRVSIKCTRM